MQRTVNPSSYIILSYILACAYATTGCEECAVRAHEAIQTEVAQDANELSLLQLRASEKQPFTTSALYDQNSYFQDAGMGCCSGPRDEQHGKLWAGPTPSLEMCKQMCRELDTCGAIEYGWGGASDHNWCFIWSQQQACLSLDTAEGSCGGAGGNTGVRVYKVGEDKTSLQDSHEAGARTAADSQETTFADAEFEFEDKGPGCCSGDRDEAHGKLWAGEMPDIKACQQKCAEIENCSSVEYGWQGSTDVSWCFLWSQQQACATLDTTAQGCGMGGGNNGVRTYKRRRTVKRVEYKDLPNATCNLCDDTQQWLFILSPDGRTGSTSIVTMLNSIPGIYMAGENGGVLEDMLSIQRKVFANGVEADAPSIYHHAISETNLLCSMQSLFRATIGGNLDKYAIVGFKEIRIDRWEQLHFFQKIFPCAKYIISYRKNMDDQIRSRQRAFSKVGYVAEDVLKEMHFELEAWSQTQQDKAFHFALEDFSVDGFNSMLSWLNVSGCRYLTVAHDNCKGCSPLGYSLNSTRVPIEGECQFRGNKKFNSGSATKLTDSASSNVVPTGPIH